MQWKEVVGQKLMIGVSGTRVTEDMIRLFRETHAGGVIFFRPNFESAESFRRLVSNLEESLERKLLTAVDHEGGRVIHLAEGVTVFPDARAFGNTAKEEYARRQGEIEARELRRLGIDLNLAPVLDVVSGDFSPNIGIRSYGKDPELVARLGAARIRAMQEAGLSACAKHFPGQGQSPLDSHLELPVLPTGWEELRSIHIKPFVRAIGAGVDAVMTSHPVYRELEPEPNCPATFSKRLVRDYLRGELGFQGVIVSDDLEMGALRSLGSIGEAGVRAAEAGHDLLLVCHSSKAQWKVFDRLVRAYRKKELDGRELERSVARIEALKAKRGVRFATGSAAPEPDGEPLALVVAKEATRVAKPAGILPLKAREDFRSVAVIFPRLSSLADQIYIEEACLNEEKFVKKILAGSGIEPWRVEIVGLNPTAEEITRACTAGLSSSLTLFFLYDAHLYPASRGLLEALEQMAGRLIVICLRDFYDEAFVKDGTACLQTYGFRAAQVRSAVETIFSHTLSPALFPSPPIFRGRG